MDTRVVLFDADGVLTLPEEVFTVMYARSRGFDPEPFEQFFRTEWSAIVTGQKDLKESITANPELWRWNGTVDELLEYWFKTEDVRNDELLAVISELKSKGLPCYLATDQETHRGAYMQNVMFKGLFDGYFISASIGTVKTDPKFFESVLELLSKEFTDLKPEEVVFFDDSQSKIDCANSTGIRGVLYIDTDSVKTALNL